jgi:hypothetical protein
MNVHALKTCEALRRWRILSEFLLSNKNTHSFMPGMPVEKDFPIKEACALYILLDLRLKHRAPKLTKQEEKKLDIQLAPRGY